MTRVTNKKSTIDWVAWLCIAGILVIIGGIGWFDYAVHGDDARLEAECKAKGGVFVEGRKPVHPCLKRAD